MNGPLFIQCPFWISVEPRGRWPQSDRRNAKAIDALIEAQNMLPGPERTEALKKADQLRHAANTMQISLFRRTQATRLSPAQLAVRQVHFSEQTPYCRH